jgi:hypothetical protein
MIHKPLGIMNESAYFSTTEYTEHTEEICFRVFRVFRGLFLSFSSQAFF